MKYIKILILIYRHKALILDVIQLIKKLVSEVKQESPTAKQIDSVAELDLAEDLFRKLLKK